MLMLSTTILITTQHVVDRVVQRGSWGGDSTIPSPGVSPEQPLPGIGLHGPPHGWQASPEFDSFHQEVGRVCAREDFFRAVLSQNGDKFASPPPRSLNDSKSEWSSLAVRSDFSF